MSFWNFVPTANCLSSLNVATIITKQEVEKKKKKKKRKNPLADYIPHLAHFLSLIGHSAVDNIAAANIFFYWYRMSIAFFMYQLIFLFFYFNGIPTFLGYLMPNHPTRRTVVVLLNPYLGE